MTKIYLTVAALAIFIAQHSFTMPSASIEHNQSINSIVDAASK